MDYIKKEWNSMTSELRNMKKRQLTGSAVNLGQFGDGAQHTPFSERSVQMLTVVCNVLQV
jgi:hypothetical protein